MNFQALLCPRYILAMIFFFCLFSSILLHNNSVPAFCHHPSPLLHTSALGFIVAHSYFMIGAEFMAAFKKMWCCVSGENPWLELRRSCSMISTIIYLSSLAVTLLAETLTNGKSWRALEKNIQGLLESQRRGRWRRNGKKWMEKGLWGCEAGLFSANVMERTLSVSLSLPLHPSPFFSRSSCWLLLCCVLAAWNCTVSQSTWGEKTFVLPVGLAHWLLFLDIWFLCVGFSPSLHKNAVGGTSDSHFSKLPL